ncbi:hypothetical protein J7L01_06940 [bacterium]|nr:hypothetical protein [bacterium]
MKGLFFILFLVVPLFAITNQAGIGLTVNLPQGEFRDNVDRVGFGIGIDYVAKLDPYIGLGGAFGVMTYGSERRNEPFSTTIPDVTVDVTTSNNFLFFQLMPRISVPISIAVPYIEGRVGLNYLWTDTRIDNQSDGEEVASSTNFDDIAFCYGGAAGLMVRVWKKPTRRSKHKGKSNDDSPDAVYIDLKAVYAKGGNAEYLKEGSVHRTTGGSVAYDVSESHTDLLTIGLGVDFDF